MEAALRCSRRSRKPWITPAIATAVMGPAGSYNGPAVRGFLAIVPPRGMRWLPALGAHQSCCLSELANDMQRQEVWLIDHLVQSERVGLIVVRPFNELAHLGHHSPRQVAGCRQRKAAAFNRPPQEDQGIACHRRAGDLADTEVAGDPDHGLSGGRLAPQCAQTFECQYRPGRLDPV